jgi:putative addiction module killer protein
LYDIRHYVTAAGRDINLEWLKQLRDPIAKVQIVKRINRVEQGNFGDHKFCREGVSEMRIAVGAGYRVYYAQGGSQVVLLLCGDRNIQEAAIDRAVRHWQDWQWRSEV